MGQKSAILPGDPTLPPRVSAGKDSSLMIAQDAAGSQQLERLVMQEVRAPCFTCAWTCSTTAGTTAVATCAWPLDQRKKVTPYAGAEICGAISRSLRGLAALRQYAL